MHLTILAPVLHELKFKTKLQGIVKKQKHAARITFHANRLDHARPLLKEMKALNVLSNQPNSNSKIYAQK